VTTFAEKSHFPDARAKRETDKALLVEIEDGDFWVPKSQIDDDSDVYEAGHTGMLITSLWWAEKERLA